MEFPQSGLIPGLITAYFKLLVLAVVLAASDCLAREQRRQRAEPNKIPKPRKQPKRKPCCRSGKHRLRILSAKRRAARAGKKFSPGGPKKGGGQGTAAGAVLALSLRTGVLARLSEGAVRSRAWNVAIPRCLGSVAVHCASLKLEPQDGH